VSGISDQLRERMERLALAAKGKADCVPVTAQVRHHAARLAGKPTQNFYMDAATFIDCQLAATELYQLDSLTTHYDFYNIEAEALGQAFIWNENEAPEADPSRRLLESAGDWRKLKPIQTGQAGRMPYVLEINQQLIDLGLAPKIRFCGPVTLASKLMGLDELLVACMTEPDEVHALLAFLTDEVIAPWIICQRERAGADDAAGGADANASPPMMTPPMIREFCLPCVQRLRESVGKVRLAAIWGESVLEDPTELLDIKRVLYPGTLQALDPDVTALGPAVFKQYADQHRMTLAMGIDAALLERGPVDAIEARTRHFIDVAGRDGRFVLFLNDIPYRTPPEHVHAAVKVAHDCRHD